MRILSVFLLVFLLSACAANKKTRQERINADYDARTSNQRSQPTVRQAEPGKLNARPGTVASQTRPETNRPAAPVKVMSDGPDLGTTPAVAARTTGEWVITSIKGKFLAMDTTGARVYMDITAKTPTGESVLDPADFVQHFMLAYVMYPNYVNRERLGYGTVPLDVQSVGRQGDHLTLTFDVKRPKGAENSVLLSEFTETATGVKARNDLPLTFIDVRFGSRFALFDKNGSQPLLQNYVNVGDTVVIRDVSGTAKKLFGIRYKHDFDAASSPMNTSARPVPRSLSVDSTLSVMTDRPTVLPGEGLYYFVEDTTQTSGIGLLVMDNRFPKLTRPEKLAKPILYMSTSSEIGELSQAQNTKKAFDRYWLSMMSGNEAVAKSTIKAYFDRVEEANRLFTTYKEGWKTDKGMIYIVLGPPDRVQRNRDREVWVYNRRANVSEVNFTFIRKPNQFVEDQYDLVRYIEYQPIWYPIVEAWRTGAVRE